MMRSDTTYGVCENLTVNIRNFARTEPSSKMLHAVERNEPPYRIAAAASTTRWPWIQNRSLFLIPCSREKTAERAQAKNLYKSVRFTKQLKLVESLGAHFRIFSSKHGIISPDLIVDGYDVSLSSLSSDQKEFLFKRTVADLEKIKESCNFKQIVIMSTEDSAEGYFYNDFMRRASSEVCSGVISIPASQTDDLAGEVKSILRRRKYVKSFYDQSGPFANLQGPFSFDSMPSQHLPKAGVYIFSDPREWSALASDYGRVVRIGTHGVSEGSKATLIQRLRAHYGLASGGGNHRSSIFRLHVGECLQLSGIFGRTVPSWQQLLPRETLPRQLEDSLEVAVSQYIRSLNIWWIDVAGRAHKNSRRSIVESKFIRNLTADGIILDGPSDNWLGSFSTRSAITNSGLWNVQHVGSPIQRKVNQLEFSF